MDVRCHLLSEARTKALNANLNVLSLVVTSDIAVISNFTPRVLKLLLQKVYHYLRNYSLQDCETFPFINLRKCQCGKR
jgi:hypothetical protein